MGKVLALFILEGGLELVNIKRVQEEQGGCKIVVFSRQSSNERHAEQLLVQGVKSEGGGAKRFDILQSLVSSGH